MDVELNKKFEQAIWVGKSLFGRNKVTGSSANMSFLHDDFIYITRSGACFGNLKDEDFVKVNMSGEVVSSGNPSKELPMHIIYYKYKSVGAVIHTHSTYSTLWSMLSHSDNKDIIPSYTPYLKMKVGKVGLVEYHPPGSKELFEAFERCVNDSDGFILKNHGPIVGGKNIMDAFYILEELEESARLAWELLNAGYDKLVNEVNV